MNDERELERHNRILEQIKNAKTKEELPRVSFSTIASYLANNVYFNNNKISQTLFAPVITALIDYGMFAHPEVKKAFIKVIIDNYPDVSDEEIVNKYMQVLMAKRIGYLLSEIGQKNIKLDEIIKNENLQKHEQIKKEINMAFEIRDLPRVGLTELNQKLLRAVNDNDFITNFKTGDIKELTNAYLSNTSFHDIEVIIEKLVSKFDLSIEEKSLMKEQIVGSLISDETIDYVVEEINLKELRKLFIYKNNHNEIMEEISNATRIYELPQNLTVSTVNNYLNGNTTIYTNDDRINTEDLRKLTDLLINGHKWEDEVVIEEVKRLAKTKYPEKDNAFDLLYSKLSSLPRTYYLVEEVNYSQKRQEEFIGRGSSNVNVYFIPNNKSPIDGGRFYNCYINRVGNLDLSEILPLDLDSIVPKNMDIDSVEWYVQQKYDKSFKAAGGIILNKDETIGNVSVFKPNDGTVGVSIEEKQKMDTISDLDLQIEEKKKELDLINQEIDDKEKKSSTLDSRMKELLVNYEKKALALQMELLKNISELKSDIGLNSEDFNNDPKEGKALKNEK